MSLWCLPVMWRVRLCLNVGQNNLINLGWFAIKSEKYYLDIFKGEFSVISIYIVLALSILFNEKGIKI